MSQHNYKAWIQTLERYDPSLIHYTTHKINQLDQLRQQSDTPIYPAQKDIFKALEMTHPNDVSVVIIGQDPYHGKDQANGLAFSVTKGVNIPPSLKNIYAELESDLNIKAPNHGDLSSWAKQGVLLLNTSLSVHEHMPLSMSKFGWQVLTSSIISATLLMDQPIVYLCWGNHALNTYIDAQNAIAKRSANVTKSINNKYLIGASHPSPFSVHRPTKRFPSFSGHKPFSKTNDLLIKHNRTPIDWSIE